MNEVQEALSSFQRWMNRPLGRVHVYTWRLACIVNPEGPVCGIRVTPAFRKVCGVESWRKQTAVMLKWYRRRGHKIKLPVYSEALGEYKFNH